ncbi:hypothetical protein [Streptomyces marianii]|uniref:hypothetical protein n=1 Tax=Streptomyces marianii TaxID=1817406 RepID=UPI001485CA04|nr:hypothetical protein [Streptomyces marianii]
MPIPHLREARKGASAPSEPGANADAAAGAAFQYSAPAADPDSTSAGKQADAPHGRQEAAGPEHGDALTPTEKAAAECPACQHKEVRAGRCGGCGAAVGAEAAAAALAGLPRNAGVLLREAEQQGWDVRAERRWTGRLWVRALVVSGLVMVRAGVEETAHVCAWNEATGKFVASASTGGFKAVREAIRAVRVVSREQEATGRTVWGRDAAEWVRQMDGAAAKVSTALCDARDAFNALDGSTPAGARAVELASAAYAEARTAERSATDAVKAARAWLAETNGEDARGCASWRRAVVLAGQHVKEAGEAITDAAARAKREALAAPIIEEAQERLLAREAQWRKRLAAEGREPSARGYAGLIMMFEDSSRRWCEWFDGNTDHDGVFHAGQGDPSRSFVAQYDAWGKSRHSDRSVHFPSRYTSASLIAGDRVDAAALAFTLAVADRIEGRSAEALRKAAAAVRKNPQGFGTSNDRKHLADWAKYPHISYGEPSRLAEHAPAEWAALETAQAAYNGVRDFHNALYWDAYYAGERANARAEADRAGLAGRDAARAERAESGRTASAWAAAVERLATARGRVHAAVVLAAGDVERAQACRGRVREGDALAEEVWSAVRSCEEAYDDVNRAKRDAAHFTESAETYRKAGVLSDFVAECARMEDAAARAESGREETLNRYGCAFDNAATAEEVRHAMLPAEAAEEGSAAVPPEREPAEEQREHAAVSRSSNAGRPEGAADDDVAGAELSAALEEGESLAAVSFVDGREPSTGWVLTTAAGHAFRIRPVTYCRPEEGQWEAGHDADGSYWWSTNIEDRSLAKVLARIREDSDTRARFAALWAKYGHYTAQAPAFGCRSERVELEPGVFLIRRFGAVGLIAACRWGFEYLTADDGREGCTGDDWARKGPDHRQYVAEWKVWSRALSSVANARLRVLSVCADDDAEAGADAYCVMSAPYVGKCSAKRSGVRFWVAVVTDQGGELGRFVACARCLSGRILDDAQGGRFSGRDVIGLARDLAKGDPRTCTLHWRQWEDRAAELCGQILTEALENGEEAPWPSTALADALMAQGAADGDDRAQREARAAVRERGGGKKAQDEAAALAAAARADRTALVASARASRAAFFARVDAASAATEAKRSVGKQAVRASVPVTAEASAADTADDPDPGGDPEQGSADTAVAARGGRAGSEVDSGGMDRWLDESSARTWLPRMGWCTGVADVLAAAYAGDLHADTSGIVRRREGQGRRVRAALVELLVSGAYIAVPRAGRRGPVTVTPDGVTAHRWCAAAPDLLHADHRAAYWARVRIHHTGRTSKQTARDRARRLAPLPNGVEEKRRRAAQLRQVEQWAKEMQATRTRLAAEQAEREAQAEQARAAEWARSQQEAEERQAVEEDRRDDGLVMSQYGPQEFVMGTGKRRVTVTRISPSMWDAVHRGTVYLVSKEGSEDGSWLVIAPDNTRIGVCSVLNDAPYASSVRDIVRSHADAMERGEALVGGTSPDAVAVPEGTCQGGPPPPEIGGPSRSRR